MIEQLTLLSCPQCELPAEASDVFSLGSTEGLIDHVAVGCVDGHHFRMPMEFLPADIQDQLRAGEAGARPGAQAVPASGPGYSRLPGRLGTVRNR
jgi:hypothetical protein